MPLEPFVVFGGNWCSGEQGWSTFRGRFATLEAATAHLSTFYSDWWQIVNTVTGQIINTGIERPRPPHHEWCPNCMTNL